MTTKILMHPKPMRRHTSHVKPANASVTIALPAQVVTRKPGLYLELSVDVGPGFGTATQLVIFPMDQLGELEAAIKALRAAGQEGGAA